MGLCDPLPKTLILLRPNSAFLPFCSEYTKDQPRSQGLFPGLGVSEGKGPGNKVEHDFKLF